MASPSAGRGHRLHARTCRNERSSYRPRGVLEHRSSSGEQGVDRKDSAWSAGALRRGGFNRWGKIMRPMLWQPPVALSPEEQSIVGRIRRAKLFVFLRERRHELFSEAFQAELAALYADSPLGQPPIAPAQLALALILQAYTGVSDDEVIEATTMDRRWQLVLDCLDSHEPPFSKGTLVGFR